MSQNDHSRQGEHFLVALNKQYVMCASHLLQTIFEKLRHKISMKLYAKRVPVYY